MVGGTASVLGGGKFANGAQTGAFSYLFNQVAHRENNAELGDIARKEAAIALASMSGKVNSEIEWRLLQNYWSAEGDMI